MTKHLNDNHQRISTDHAKITLAPDAEFLMHLTNLITRSSQTINISTFMGNLLEYKNSRQARHLLKTLQMASQRGVAIRILASRAISKKHFKNVPAKIRKYSGKGIYHAKFVVVDSQEIILGSHNITYNGTMKNKEVSLVLSSRQLGRQLETYFNAEWSLAQSVV